MEYCLRCASTIEETSQYYHTDDLGPEIISVLERNLNHEIDHNGVVCSQCFSNILQELSTTVPQRTSESSSRSEEHELQFSHDSNVCVWCRNSLYERRAQTIPAEGPARNLISDRISPREIPENGMVCYACWYRAQRTLQQQGVICPPTVNLNECVWCHRSLARTRRHSLPQGPERDEIIARIYPREIPPGGLVCYACWVAARRNVQRAQNVEQEQSSSSHYGAICAWCEVSIYRRQTHILSHGPEREEVETRIYPRELPEHALVCLNCWTRAQENIAIHEGNLIQPVSTSNENVTLDEFVHTSSSSSHCFVPSCGNPERNRVPNYLRKLILKTQKIFVIENARICNEHKTFYNWEFLDRQHFSNTFNKDEVQSMLRLSIQDTKMFLDFEKINEIEDSLFRFWTGVTKENFFIIFNQISPDLQCKYPKTALGAYLIKCRTGDSHERLSSLLSVSKTSVIRLINTAREALLNLFVPFHLGLHHLSREEIINRNLIIPEGLFGNREERVPIVICDGTYINIQKSSNYNFQKKTYSLHKYHNLVKPFLLVTTDGHIIDVTGPYPATKSDADIMKALFQNENGDFRRYFRENDVFILDRGFRDAIPLLEEIGYKIYKPESLEHGEFQLPTLKANHSRCVTLCRWVVEIVNGRFKRDYKLFRQDFFQFSGHPSHG